MESFGQRAGSSNNRYNASMRTLAVLLTTAVALTASDASERINEAASVLQEIMGIKEQTIPQELLDNAECAIIVPGVKKGAFMVGAKYGRGFASCRTEKFGWTSPAAMRMEGGSFGFQIGGSETDVLMLILNRRGMDKLLTSKFTLGGDASVAAGPVGRTSSAETDALMRAEILSWSRSRGVFAGISLKGSTMRPDDTANRQLYGRDLTNREILTGKIPNPEAAEKFVSLLNKYSGRK